MIERIKVFLAEVRTEIRKVVFPGRSEVQGATWVVIVVVLVVSAYLWVVDLGLVWSVSRLFR
ncbi:MAG: preprotein translocase subunit SecE [Nitrospirae bacterium RBG_16_64_22]|nr:MAG: preprotein translocase subunit SecE [Nitrospirae bacterium RBG_16_64_22]